MVKLRNIEKNNSTIRCNIYPEDSTLPGTIEVSISDNKILNYILPQGYEWCRNHVDHAYQKLVEIANDKEFKEEYTIMWY